MATEEKSKGSERWTGAITNLTEMASNLESLQKLLLKKAVFVDEETFAKASLSSEQARTIKVGHPLFGLWFCDPIHPFLYYAVFLSFLNEIAWFCLIWAVFAEERRIHVHVDSNYWLRWFYELFLFRSFFLKLFPMDFMDMSPRFWLMYGLWMMQMNWVVIDCLIILGPWRVRFHNRDSTRYACIWFNQVHALKFVWSLLIRYIHTLTIFIFFFFFNVRKKIFDW